MEMPLQFGPLKIGIRGHPLKAIQELIRVSEAGGDLAPAIQAATRSFGFEVFAQGVVMSLRPEVESQVYVFSTHTPAWIQTYDQRALVEVDPRVDAILATALPVIWDQDTFRGASTAVDEFLDEAMAFGIGSGVAIPVHDSRGYGSMAALSSERPRYDAVRLSLVNDRLGEIVLFAQCLHEIFVAAVTQRGITTPLRGVSLSGRERECLTHASHGLTSDDIAGRLQISARTVEFHFASIRSKLASGNRQEAIAKAITTGLIHP